MPPKKKLVKPKKVERSYYEWHDITEYIEKKYKCDTRDFAGRYKKGAKYTDTTPYQDFWHWVLSFYDIHNGSLDTFRPGEHLDEALNPDKKRMKDPDYVANHKETYPEWVVAILTMYRDEFGDEFDVVFSW